VLLPDNLITTLTHTTFYFSPQRSAKHAWVLGGTRGQWQGHDASFKRMGLPLSRHRRLAPTSNKQAIIARLDSSLHSCLLCLRDGSTVHPVSCPSSSTHHHHTGHTSVCNHLSVQQDGRAQSLGQHPVSYDVCVSIPCPCPSSLPAACG
jgi:hypothetical protein